MSSSDLQLTRLAAALSGAFLFISGNAGAEEPASVTDRSGPSIYDERPASIYDGQKDDRDLIVKRERQSGATHILGEVRKLTEKMKVEPLFDKDGKPVRDIRIKIDGPSKEVDSNGRPMTMQQKFERDRVHDLSFKILKAQGYTWEEHKKKLEEKKKEPDEWQVKTEATKRYIAEHGPITSETFIRPGLTPEESAALNSPGTAYRHIDGKWVIVDKRGKPVLQPRRQVAQEKPAPAKPQPLTTVTTKITKRPARSSDVQAILSAEERTKAGIQSTAAKKELIDDIMKGSVTYQEPSLTVKEIEKLFPDLDKGSVTYTEIFTPKATQPVEVPDVLLSPEERKAKESKVQDLKLPGKPVSFLERSVISLFGIRSAHAETVGFAHEDGREYRSDRVEQMNDELREKMKLPENRHQETVGAEYQALAKQLADEADRISEKARKARDAMEKAVSPVKGSVAAGQFLDELTQAAQRGGKEGLTAQAAQFAADIVHQTGSLTKGEFEADAKLVSELLSDKVTGEAFIGELRKILRAHPEIYDAEPNADAELDRLAQDRFGIGAVPDDPKGSTTYVFLSRSLGEAALKSVLERASAEDRNNVVLVFRGVPEGKNINDGIAEIHQLGAKLNPMPNTVIDPTLFKKYDVTLVPTVVRVKGHSVIAEAAALKDGAPGGQERKFGDVVAKVEGLDNDMWLLDQIDAGERGDLGVHGDTQPISEPDLIEVMKAKAASIDWEAKKAAAIKNAWKHQTFLDLPKAEKARLRRVDPTILVDKDIKDFAGHPIRKAGDRVNPLEIQPFTLTLLVFDPLSDDELQRVKRFLSRNRMAGKPAPVLIATRIDKEKGWDSYKSLTDLFDQHLFVLNDEVKNTFEIEATPTVIRADNREHVFLVEELGPVDDNKKKAGE